MNACGKADCRICRAGAAHLWCARNPIDPAICESDPAHPSRCVHCGGPASTQAEDDAWLAALERAELRGAAPPPRAPRTFTLTFDENGWVTRWFVDDAETLHAPHMRVTKDSTIILRADARAVSVLVELDRGGFWPYSARYSAR